MALYLTRDSDLIDLADALRRASGTTGPLSFPRDFLMAVEQAFDGIRGENLITGHTGWTDGYLASGGHISTQDPVMQERTTDPIPLPADSTGLLLMVELPAGSSAWNGYFFYDAQGNRVGNRRQVTLTQIPGGTRALYSGVLVLGEPEAVSLRISLRTYGDARVYLDKGNPIRSLFEQQALELKEE